MEINTKHIYINVKIKGLQNWLTFKTGHVKIEDDIFSGELGWVEDDTVNQAEFPVTFIEATIYSDNILR
jgi:hypothetical protein